MSISKLVTKLRKLLPLLLPVRVLYRKGLEDHGSSEVVPDSRGKPKSFRIYLDDTKCFHCLFHTLIHEWAHCRIWREGSLDDHHSADFGVAWAEVYRVTLGASSAP